MPLSRICQNSDEFIGPFVKGRVLDGCAFPQIGQRWSGCGSRLGAELFSVKKILLAKIAAPSPLCPVFVFHLIDPEILYLPSD